VKKSTPWQSSLPALQGAEKTQNLHEARVFVAYPVLPQNLHKLALVIAFVNSTQVTQQSVYLFSGVLEFFYYLF
jgi:hypothetical protein